MRISTLNTGQIDEIKQLFHDSFADSEGAPEGELIGNLAYEILTTTPEKDFYCFVAQHKATLTGGIIFSRLSFKQEKVNVFLLSPVAVKTDYQRQGVGQKIISFGLKTLKEKSIAAVVTYGDPNYYSKIGFKPISEDVIKAPLNLSFPDGWLGQSLTGESIKPIASESYCIDAFNKPEIW